jgi:hypothetical protein
VRKHFLMAKQRIANISHAASFHSPWPQTRKHAHPVTAPCLSPAIAFQHETLTHRTHLPVAD